MKILFLTTHFNTGGITTYILTLGEALVKSGHQVWVASSGGNCLARLEAAGMRHVTVNIRTKSEIHPKVFLSIKPLAHLLRQEGIDVIACPTCGRCQIDLIPLAESISEKVKHIRTPLKVAVMGCAVNGPGEAAAADVGIAGGDGKGMLIKKGEIVKLMDEADLEKSLLDEIEAMTGETIPR